MEAWLNRFCAEGHAGLAPQPWVYKGWRGRSPGGRPPAYQRLFAAGRPKIWSFACRKVFIRAVLCNNCAWLPRSIISPFSITIISSALAMVERRCAMTMLVQFSWRLKGILHWFSLSVSKGRGGLVEYEKWPGFEYSAGNGKALFCPPLSLLPRSPMLVW